MRARNIKPGFFKNEDLAECDLQTRLLFIGLWCMADREGRLEYRPKRIKAEVMPYDNCNIEKLLTQLADKNFIQIYTVSSGKYISILNFGKHQNCHIKEAASTIPAPCEHDTSMEVAQLNPESLLLNPESLLLNPESLLLNPESTTDIPDKSGVAPIPYKEIIEYLNLKTGKNFDHTAKETRVKLKARWGNNGNQRTLQDFKTVIDNKCAKWLCDSKMVDFLRPETLFGNKFESYLNEKTHPLAGQVSDKTIQTIESFKKWSPPS